MKKQFIIENVAHHDYTSNNTYVYELINPITNLPFYVGKGRDDRAQRHISLRKNAKLYALNPHKVNTINQIIDFHNHMVIVRIVDTFENEDDAFTRERELITRYGRVVDHTGGLTNIQTGGEGAARDGIKVDQYTMWGEFMQTWKNAKEAARLNGWGQYAGISGCCTGRERSYKGSLWCYHGTPPKLLATVKPVYQWTLNGEFVAVHRSAAAAARSAEEFVCSGQLLTASKQLRPMYGYQWTTVNTSPGSYSQLSRSRSRCASIKNTTTGVVFNSVHEVVQCDGVKLNNLYSVLSNHQVSTGGFNYCYVNV